MKWTREYLVILALAVACSVLGTWAFLDYKVDALARQNAQQRVVAEQALNQLNWNQDGLERLEAVGFNMGPARQRMAARADTSSSN